MELNCSSPDPLCSSPGFRVPTTSSQHLSPTTPLLALPLSIAKEQPDKIFQKEGAGLHQLHAHLSVLHRRGGLNNLRKGTGRSFGISSYRRSQSLCHFGARLQYLAERTTIRTSFQCLAIRKTESLLTSPIKNDIHLVISCVFGFLQIINHMRIDSNDTQQKEQVFSAFEPSSSLSQFEEGSITQSSG